MQLSKLQLTYCANIDYEKRVIERFPYNTSVYYAMYKNHLYLVNGEGNDSETAPNNEQFCAGVCKLTILHVAGAATDGSPSKAWYWLENVQ